MIQENRTAPLIQRLPANTRGRDFVCGDIHGSYSCVERFLKEVDFDPLVDRFICAGDLVDRGPDNEKCLGMLFEPWFYSTLGNHEELMVEYFTDRYPGMSMWAYNGGGWGTDYNVELSDNGVMIRGLVADVLPGLPYLITVEKPDGSAAFHVMHAELSSRVPLSDEDLADEKKFRQLATLQTQDGDTVLWGRWRFYRFYAATITDEMIRKAKVEAQLAKTAIMYSPQLSMIYSGHTPVKQPTQFYGQTNLDTMAYDSYKSDRREWSGLTVTEPATGKFWLVNDRVFKQVSPLVISGDLDVA